MGGFAQVFSNARAAAKEPQKKEPAIIDPQAGEPQAESPDVSAQRSLVEGAGGLFNAPSIPPATIVRKDGGGRPGDTED